MIKVVVIADNECDDNECHNTASSFIPKPQKNREFVG